MMLAVGGVMILTFLFVGAMPNMASERWVFVIGCVSGVVVAASGYVLRKRDRWP
jgi:hypothetical protein